MSSFEPLVEQRRLTRGFDFGCAAVGDPACDLVMAWTFFTDAGRAAFRRGLPLDDGTWARGRGWALWKALITLAREKQGGESANEAAWSVRMAVQSRRGHRRRHRRCFVVLTDRSDEALQALPPTTPLPRHGRQL